MTPVGMLDAPLIAGPLPTVLSAVGAVGLFVLLARRPRRWWRRHVPICIGTGVLVAAVVGAGVEVDAAGPSPPAVRGTRRGRSCAGPVAVLGAAGRPVGEVELDEFVLRDLARSYTDEFVKAAQPVA